MGKTLIFTPDPKNPPELSPEAAARLDAMSDAEAEANARSDPDNPPLSDAQLERIAVAHVVRRVHAGTGLSQAGFARRFGISVDTVRDWEQARRTPDRAALSYLRVIEREPDAVARALETA